MKLALETPTKLLTGIQPLGDFDFALTHLILKDKVYAQYYKDSTRFKILDNSTNEKLKPCSLQDIKRAADIIKPDLVVAPDFLGNSKATIAALEDFIKVFSREKTLPVVQGETTMGVLKCLKASMNFGLNCIAVPYDICCQREDSLEHMAETRVRVVNAIIREVPIGFKIHLLGMTTLEELGQHNRSWVTSVDTGSPILHGLNELRYGRDSLLDKTLPTYNKMVKFTSYKRHMSSIYYNLAYLRKLLN